MPDSVDGQAEQVVDVLVVPPADQDFSVGLLSSDGRFKRLAGQDLRELSGRATTVLKLKDGVQLQRVVMCRPGDDLAVASSTGRMLRLPVDDSTIPVMGRTAQGPVLMRLLPGESIVGAAAVAAGGDVLLISQLGQLKRLGIDHLRRCQRGAIGEIGLRFEQRNDALTDLRSTTARLSVETQAGSLRLASDSLPVEDGRGTGQQLKLPKGQTVQRLLPLIDG